MASNNLKLDLQPPPLLDQRIEDFKNDPERMREVNEFLSEVVDKAREEAEVRRAQQGKSRMDSLGGFHNGSRKIGASINKAKTSARTFASRVLTAICNCTNTFKTVVTVNRN